MKTTNRVCCLGRDVVTFTNQRCRTSDASKRHRADEADASCISEAERTLSVVASFRFHLFFSIRNYSFPLTGKS